MKRFSGPLGSLQGSRVLFSDFVDDGVMWKGHGPRESIHEELFAEPFAEPPLIMVGISMWDMDHNANSRADISAANITTTGFQIIFRTWGDTRIARIRADWTAIGTVRDDDNWDVS
jgi:hypothetical protein